MEKKIFALLVGITNYQKHIGLDNDTVYFPELSGCVNDAMKLKAFLQENVNNIFIEELYNEQATKTNICNTFLTHFKQAQKGDSILFYFSGHGTQEFADACFHTETDKKLECLVAYYDNGRDSYLIADKELRYLISQVAEEGISITFIVDCCHSGDVTRNAEMVKANYSGPIEKKSSGTYTFSQRNWDGFIFHKLFSPEAISKTGMKNLLPESNHISFSASESNESAYEINGEGIFTKHLVDALTVTNGIVSNKQLFDRISMRMKYAYDQSPKLYSPTKSTLKAQGFLDSAITTMVEGDKAYYNPKVGWIVNRGALNGLHMGLEEIDLYDPEDKSKNIKGKIESVKADHTLLKVSSAVDRNKVLIANTQYLSKRIIKLCLDLGSAIPKDALAILEAIDKIPQNEINIVIDESGADFVLRYLHGIYYITKPLDLYCPISEGIAFSNFQEIIEQLRHLSSWKFIYELSTSADEKLDKNKFTKIEFALGEKPYETFNQEILRALKIDQWEQTTDGYTIGLKVKITNVSQQKLYVAVIYLDINYSSSTSLLEPSPYFLDPGNSVELNIGGDPQLNVDLAPQALYFNYKQYTERFKIIVNDTPFDTYPHELDALPEPPLPGMETLRGIKGIRQVRTKQKKLEGWFITSLDLVSANPEFNKIPSGRIKQMLNDKTTTAFAEGLFFTTNTGDDSGAFSTDLHFKPEIVIVDDQMGIERGPVMDLANWWSRRKRNNYYEEIVRRFPERIKIVSEGDSWFQHPLVYDTIDHLSKIYAIRCVAAAGDTLSNYLSGSKKRGDYFLDVLRQTKPAFFLISGGGNDILGSQFRNFLVDRGSDMGLGNLMDGSQFLKENFDIEMDKLMDIYYTVFDLLSSGFPNMKTIVHGYDYPVHLDSPNKGWLGRYMIEKGISDPTQRQMVIKYIMDKFNTRLGETASKFPDTVRYLDLRNTVRYKTGEIDQWYDEIHPNIDGFQLIALKFIKLIESLKV
jgi:lysophospholipase L1-like esterase